MRFLSGESRLRGSAIKKVKNYYQEVAWGAVSNILDHVILWWSREALATRHSHGAQHLKDWLRHFIQGNESKKFSFYIKGFSSLKFFKRICRKNEMLTTISASQNRNRITSLKEST